LIGSHIICVKMEVSQRLFETGTECFAAKSKWPEDAVAEPAATSPSKSRMKASHKSTVLMEEHAESLQAYKVDEPQPSSPLRIVQHRDGNGNLEQKQNPDQTHRGRIRNTAGGFFNS
jgi:hypothetical protein